MKKTTWVIIILLLILLGGFYRVYALDNDSYWIDESYTVLASKNIGEYGVPMFDSGINYNRSLLQSYSLFIIGIIFGFGHIAMRILSALAGTALIYFVFLLVKKHHDEITGLITAGLVTFSYFMIAWSRQSRMYIFVALFAVLAVHFYFSYLKGNKGKDLLWMLLFIFLGYTFNPVIAVVFIGIILHYIILRREKSVVDLKKLYYNHKTVFVIVSLILIIGIVYFLIGAVSSMTFEKSYLDAYQSFLLSTQYYILFFAVIGLFGIKKNLEKNSFYFLVIVVAFLSASLIVKDLNYRYLFIVLPFLYILASQGIMYLIGIYKNKFYKIGMMLVIIAIFIISGYIFLPQQTYHLELGTPQPPFEDAYKFVKNMNSDNYTLIVTQPAISELYFKKADYWLAISYEDRLSNMAYNKTTGVESYTGIQTIDSAEKLLEIDNALIIIDDMGLDRLNSETRELVMNYTLLASFGDKYWDSVYVYKD